MKLFKTRHEACQAIHDLGLRKLFTRVIAAKSGAAYCVRTGTPFTANYYLQSDNSLRSPEGHQFMAGGTNAS